MTEPCPVCGVNRPLEPHLDWCDFDEPLEPGDVVTGIDLYNEHRGHPYVNESPSEFVPGVRVEIQPWTDDWMRGDRFATVVGMSSRGVSVKMDKSGHVRTVEEKGLRRADV